MSEKEKLPFWLGVVLGMILGMSGVLVVIVPQLDRSESVSYTVEEHEPGLKKSEMNQGGLNPPVFHDTVSNKNDFSSPPDYQTNSDMEGATAVASDKKIPTPTSSVRPVEQDVEAAMVPEAASIQPKVVVVQEKRHGIALVIDDAGYDLRAVERVLALSVPVAVSILPESPFARQSAILAKEAGQVVMLHLPMQPEDPSLQMTEDFLLGNMEKQAIRKTFLKDLEKVPFAEGVNNHMGSRLTQLDRPMHWVMQVCREKGLFFVDSRTSAQSVAAMSARSMGIAWASRSIFLDHEMTLEAMKHAWQRARNCAKKKLSCVVIAHPRAKTVTFLENYLSKEDAKNMVSIRHLLQTTPIIARTSKVTLP